MTEGYITQRKHLQKKLQIETREAICFFRGYWTRLHTYCVFDRVLLKNLIGTEQRMTGASRSCYNCRQNVENSKTDSTISKNKEVNYEES